MVDTSRALPSWLRAATVPLCAAALVILVALAYLNSLHGPFVFDDRAAILENASLRPDAAVGESLLPSSGGATTSGRPLVNLSLRLNFLWSGLDPWSYHVTNISIHVAAALLLFALVRLTWMRVAPHVAEYRVTRGAFFIALLWGLHPLQTAAVSYIVQRAEALAAAFILLSLLLFARGVAATRPHAWFIGCIVAAAVGSTAKETAAVTPLLLLLYDRTFVAGSFAAAWRARRATYLGLGATWLVPIALLLLSNARGGTVGFTSISPWHYLLTQADALALYFSRVVWPHPLVFDYGDDVVTSVGEVLLPGLVVVALLTATIVALRRCPVAGFLGVSVFLLLAPTSSIVPIATQTIAEHRMYLPLAPILVGLVLLADRLPGRITWPALVALAAVYGSLTVTRNRTYVSEIDLWRHTAQHAPHNLRAHVNLGSALLEAGRAEEAVAAYERALGLEPNASEVHAALSQALLRTGNLKAAVTHGETAVRLDPELAIAHLNLAAALLRERRIDEAIRHFERARRLEPDAVDIPPLLATALLQRARDHLQQGRRASAQEDARAALAEAPEDAQVQFDAGNVLAASGDLTAALTAYTEALRLAPDMLAARNNLANALLVVGRVDEAIVEYEHVLRERPNDASVRANLEEARRQQRMPRSR